MRLYFDRRGRYGGRSVGCLSYLVGGLICGAVGMLCLLGFLLWPFVVFQNAHGQSPNWAKLVEAGWVILLFFVAQWRLGRRHRRVLRARRQGPPVPPAPAPVPGPGPRDWAADPFDSRRSA
jgi:hypothetical protein